MQMRLNSFCTTDGLIDNDDGGEKIKCLLHGGHGNQAQSNINNRRGA